MTLQGKTFKLKNARWQMASFKKIEEVQYIRKVLINFAEIWHNDASQPSGRQIKF